MRLDAPLGHGAVAVRVLEAQADLLAEAALEGGQRMQMSEVALYKVAGGKIVQEEFLYQVG
ncbi:MAG: hypothetical protein QNK04_26645 [Myxococcota bacterium]|nr:hypothetical protein [Myxococcota bacterium]